MNMSCSIAATSKTCETSVKYLMCLLHMASEAASVRKLPSAERALMRFDVVVLVHVAQEVVPAHETFATHNTHVDRLV